LNDLVDQTVEAIKKAKSKIALEEHSRAPADQGRQGLVRCALLLHGDVRHRALVPDLYRLHKRQVSHHQGRRFGFRQPPHRQALSCPLPKPVYRLTLRCTDTGFCVIIDGTDTPIHYVAVGHLANARRPFRILRVASPRLRRGSSVLLMWRRMPCPISPNDDQLTRRPRDCFVYDAARVCAAVLASGCRRFNRISGMLGSVRRSQGWRRKLPIAI
jgi:hypothetical protein